MLSNIVELIHMGTLNKYVAIFPWHWMALEDNNFMDCFPEIAADIHLEKRKAIIEKMRGDCYCNTFDTKDGNNVLVNAPKWQIKDFR